MHYSHFTYAAAFWISLANRFYHVAKGNKPVRLENVLVFVELAVLMAVADELMTGFWVWVVMHTTCSFTMLTIGATASHHHTTCFVDGDEPLEDPDFGYKYLFN